MTEFQKAIHEWQLKTFPDATMYSKYCHLEEEIEELECEVLHFMNTGENETTLGMEIADCMLLLVGIASFADIDVLKVMRDKMIINKKRKWGNPDKTEL